MFRANGGKVILVGAGPGEPELLTLRGYQCLQQAEVVVHDRLINNIIKEFAPQAEWIDVGKLPNHHPVPQSKINALLVELGLAGKRVVRLKGGDPFVFGRGGEEALALVEQGIPFEIVPGVSSAIAAPAYAGIPVTQRGIACSATIITGHRADFCSDPSEDWSHAVQGGDTLVFLMGMQNLPALVDHMRRAGRPGDTPVAIIERATYASQKVVSGTLDHIIQEAADIHPPAVIIVGEVVKLGRDLSWFHCFENRPLQGTTILDTRPDTVQMLRESGGLGFSQPWVDDFRPGLVSLGAETVNFPAFQWTPNVAAVHKVLDHLLLNENQQKPDWLCFTNESAARYFFSQLHSQGYDARVFGSIRLAVTSQEIGKILLQYGLRADLRLDHPEVVSGTVQNEHKILLVCAQGDCLEGIFAQKSHSGHITEANVLLIQTVAPDPTRLEGLLEAQVDLVTFTSPVAVEQFLRLLDHVSNKNFLSAIKVACAGKDTLAYARKLQIPVDIAAEDASTESLISVILEWKKNQLLLASVSQRIEKGFAVTKISNSEG